MNGELLINLLKRLDNPNKNIDTIIKLEKIIGKMEKEITYKFCKKCGIVTVKIEETKCPICKKLLENYYI